MKALSIKQPWAWAILRKGKDIENRSWRTDKTGRILIHAGKSFDKSAPKELIKEYQLAAIHGDDATLGGGLIGSVKITGCVHKSESPWFTGSYGFTLADASDMEFVACKGKLSFFDVSDVLQKKYYDHNWFYTTTAIKLAQWSQEGFK